MVLAWIFTCAMIVKSIVHEKEMRLKQTMQVMGLRNWVFWFGWVIDSLVPMTFVVILLTIILVVSLLSYIIIASREPCIVIILSHSFNPFFFLFVCFSMEKYYCIVIRL